MNLTELKKKSMPQLLEIAESMNLENLARSRKQDVIFSILKAHAKSGEDIYGDGVLEILSDGFGFLRSADSSYLAGPDDIYVSPSQIRRFNLRKGDSIAGKIRPPKDSERYFALLKVDEINFDKPENAKNKILFENLTPLFPQKRLTMEQGNGSTEDLTARIIDLVCPIGKGQRALIVSPPKAGKTLMLQNIANSIVRNNPECYLIVLLIDERPEEVTEMQRTVRGEVVASTFDEPPARHVQVAEMVIEKAKRLTEHKRDVIILLDSITRLARAYNTVQPSSGKVLTGGVDAHALERQSDSLVPLETSKKVAVCPLLRPHWLIRVRKWMKSSLKNSKELVTPNSTWRDEPLRSAFSQRSISVNLERAVKIFSQQRKNCSVCGFCESCWTLWKIFKQSSSWSIA